MSPAFTAVITASEVRWWGSRAPPPGDVYHYLLSGAAKHLNITSHGSEPSNRSPSGGLSAVGRLDARPRRAGGRGGGVCAWLYVCVCACGSRRRWGVEVPIHHMKGDSQNASVTRWKPKPGRMMRPNARVFGRFGPWPGRAGQFPLEQVLHSHMLTGSGDTRVGGREGGSGTQGSLRKMLF